MLTPMRVPGVAILSALTALAAPALAQHAPEYRLDPSGNWVQVSAPAPGTDEAIIADARKALAEDRPADAQRLVDPLIEKAGRSTSNPLIADALVIRADATTAQGDEYEALYDYERAIKEYTGSPSFILAVERELDIGVRYLNGMNRKVMGMRVLDAADIGEELAIRVQERMPGSRLAERAGIELADHYYREHNLDLAVEAYDLFVENYPNSQYKQRAMQRRIYATIARFKGPNYDGSSLVDARILTRRYSSLYPTEAQKAGLDDGLVTRLDESAAESKLHTAEWYLKRSDEVAARLILRRLVRDHPKTAATQKAIAMMKERGWSFQPTSTPATPTEPAVGEQARTLGAAIETKPAETKPEPKTGPLTVVNTRPPPVEPRRRKPNIPPNSAVANTPESSQSTPASNP